MTPSAALVAGWVSWVAALTGLPPAMPSAVTVGQPPHERIHPAGHGGLQALTTADGHVYLHPGWREGDTLDDCLLAHELVHVAQFAAGRRPACVPEMERLAYAVQEICLARRGTDFWAATGWRPRELAKLMECG